MSSAAKAPALTHIALDSSDPEASIAFYQDWCGMEVVHKRASQSHQGRNVYWLSSPEYKGLFAIVLLPGRIKPKQQTATDYSHLGFAVDTEEEIYRIERRAKDEGILFWPVSESGWPVGTWCAVTDPDGYVVEFSHGQPIGFDHNDPEVQAKLLEEGL
ncbi:MAG: VOC family protein [Alphaproteobacteria bacterium]